MPDSPCSGKNFRLNKAADFTRVFRKGRRSTDELFKVIAVHANSKFPRLGMVVAKRYIAHAVKRNRVKRIIRESFRSHHGQLEGLDVIVMAREGCAEHLNRDLFVSLEKHWSRIAEQ